MELVGGKWDLQNVGGADGTCRGIWDLPCRWKAWEVNGTCGICGMYVVVDKPCGVAEPCGVGEPCWVAEPCGVDETCWVGETCGVAEPCWVGEPCGVAGPCEVGETCGGTMDLWG